MGRGNQGNQQGRKRPAWNNHTKQKCVEVGLSGLFFTCHGDEKRALFEAYSLIDKLHEFDPTSQIDDNDEDALEKQCAAIREAHGGKEMRKQRPTGVKNCLFVSVPGADPTTLAAQMVDLCQKESQSRFLDRVIPVHKTENVELPKLNELVFEMVKTHLDASKSPIPTYALEFKTRNNDAVKRQNVLEMLNDAVMALCPAARVNLSDPDITFFVQVVRKTMMVGVAMGYNRRRKYSMRTTEELDERREKEHEALNKKKEQSEKSENASEEVGNVASENDKYELSEENIEKEKNEGEPEEKRQRIEEESVSDEKESSNTNSV